MEKTWKKLGFFKKVIVSAIRILTMLVFLFVALVVYSELMFISEKISQKESPNGEFTIKEIRSKSERVTAPYGTELKLSEGFFSSDKVFLAGYFRSDLHYEWVDNKNILVKFSVRTEKNIVLMENLVNGIAIKYDYIVEPPEKGENKVTKENNTPSDLKIMEYIKNQTKFQKGILNFPYVADKARKDLIISGIEKIGIGANPEKLIELFSLPDEVNPTYRNIGKNSKITGFSFVYIIQRLKKSGSQNEKKEILVRCYFDLDFKFRRMDITVSGSDNSASKQDLVKKIKEFENHVDDIKLEQNE